MPVGINGYNNDFSRFVNFAMEHGKNGVTAAKSDAIARMSVGGESGALATSPLAGRTIKAATTDKVGVFSRRGTEQTANNATREAFLKSVADMFGGFEKIPPSVRDALKLGDYNKGKPLTARRIIAVKVAVDAERASWAPKSKPINLNYVDTCLSGTELEGKKFLPFEKERINNGVPLLFASNPLLAGEKDGVLTAIKELATEGTPANRLMKYGGCFTENGNTFKEGLELLEQFDHWFDQVIAEAKGNGDKSATARTIYGAAQDIKCKNYFEKMIFEDLAINPGRIKPTAEETFGVENNPVTRFFASAFSNSQNGTLLHMDPAKRSVLCDAFDVLVPRVDAPNGQTRPEYPARILSRMLLKFDDVFALHSSGRLTAESLEKVLYPGINKGDGKTPLERINTLHVKEGEIFEKACVDAYASDPDVKAKASQILTAYMRCEETGATVDEECKIMSGGKSSPTLEGYVPYSASMSNLDGTDKGALWQLAEDVCRPSPVRDLTTGQAYEAKFTFKFGTGEPITPPNTLDRKQRDDHAGALRDQVRTMTGDRPAQTTSVLYMMSQSGLMALKHGIPSHGLGVDEHTGINMHLTRDDDTGSVTINYHSIDESPVPYHWTATIDPEGRTTITPLVVEDRK